MDVTEVVNLVFEVGFPIAAAFLAGYFVFLTLKYILANVTKNVRDMSLVIKSLEKRISTMNTEIIHIDTKISLALKLKPDYNRLSRSEQADTRID